ncbi:hypothetical protein DSO57_1005389 [Entomophthora muscae]|uniref:Uncharacterized protein n=1 Tax=Entomophthora muscae TaxID=34485 RepID=A0ACC2RZ43_9FUNG|nr:hypothetical protein DSO57_1005389 [Entomophthora muscae]
MELRNPISYLCTWIKVSVFDTPIRALLDTGAPTNIIYSQLVKRLGFLPDISYAEFFFTAGVESIKSNGAYSSVPLRFGELVVTYPAVLLKSESYDMLIATYMNISSSWDVFLVSKKKPGRQHVCLWYPHGVLGLPYRVANASFKPLPAYGNNQKSLKLRSNQLIRIPSKTQVATDTGLYLDLPPGLHLEISSINGVLRKEPLAAPGICDSAAQEALKVLFLNPLSTEMKVSKGQHVATLRIGHNEELSAVHFLGGLEELGISLPDEPLVAAIIP